MKRVDLPRPLRGVVPPMVTPLKDRDTLDVAGLERLVEHILAGGVQGLFALGSTGEGPSLSYKVRYDLIDRVCRLVGDRVPVLVGVTDTAFVESVNVARRAADAGAAGVVLATPYYFLAGQPELLEYVQHIAAEIPLPIFLYNMPSMTKLSFTIDLLREAFKIPGIVGLKDSSSDMVYLHKVKQLIEERPDVALLVGPEELLAEAVLMGAHGGIGAGANLNPRLFVNLYEAAAQGDLERVRELHGEVMNLRTRVYTVGKHGSAVIKGIKCALSCLGICDDTMAEPFHRFREPERAQIEKHVEELGLTRYEEDS